MSKHQFLTPEQLKVCQMWEKSPANVISLLRKVGLKVVEVDIYNKYISLLKQERFGTITKAQFDQQVQEVLNQVLDVVADLPQILEQAHEQLEKEKLSSDTVEFWNQRIQAIGYVMESLDNPNNR